MAAMGQFITMTDKSPLLQILVWLFFICVLMCYVLRALVKVSRQDFHRPAWTYDDSFLTCSLLFCLCQSIAISVGATNGLGESEELLDPDSISASLKVRLLR